MTGLIPAHAGKTSRGLRSSSPRAAHPRSRGENAGGRDVLPGVNGSSPLTRGKPALPVPLRNVSRLIPAHAGKTLISRAVASQDGAHPRSRGENVFGCGKLTITPGSSPLTRGKHAMDQTRGEVLGLIPAHAGKTPRFFRAEPSCGAHPRSRGENYASDAFGEPVSGSSPLTRGKRLPSRQKRGHTRLIPAHAGKTATGVLRSSATQAHPRSRGENRIVLPSSRRFRGSSPLTRGKR